MKSLKVRSFTIDKALGFLIQGVTKDPTQEILTYFYGIAQFVIDDLSKTSKATYLDKNIILFYKETPITYRIRIQGSGPKARSYYDNADFQPHVSIDVTFPKDSSNFEVGELMNAAVESGLGLTDENNMPAFERPQLKTPKSLRQVRLAQEEKYELGTTESEDGN